MKSGIFDQFYTEYEQGNSMGGGTWQPIVHEATKSQTPKKKKSQAPQWLNNNNDEQGTVRWALWIERFTAWATREACVRLCKKRQRDGTWNLALAPLSKFETLGRGGP